MQEAMKTLQTLVNEIQEVTEALKQAAVSAQWDEFLTRAQQRAVLLEQFRHQAVSIQSQYQLKPEDDLNHWVKNEFRKVAKVDREIGDIMDRHKEELISKIMETRNGQRFLKNYKNKVNFERIVSKVY